ncbi:MAG: hypothetical protein AAFO94_20090, partial [Bacteroidota bacterium]
MRILLILVFFVTGLSSNAQVWQTLDYSPDQDSLEYNPLKGFADLFGSDNGFPHSLRGYTFTLGEVMNGIDDFNFETLIDPLLEQQASEGRSIILQINVDSGKKINPNAPGENAGEAYFGARFDLPDNLSAVQRIY